MGLPTSATTVTVMCCGSTPTSGDPSCAVAHAAGLVPAAGVVVPLRPPPLALLLDLPLLQAATTSMSDTASANERRRILSPGLLSAKAAACSSALATSLGPYLENSFGAIYVMGRRRWCRVRSRGNRENPRRM